MGEEVRTIGQIKKIDNLVDVISLLREGPALLTFDNLSEKLQKNPDAIETALLGAFAIDSFQTYDSLLLSV